jgi:hypothetical protein
MQVWTLHWYQSLLVYRKVKLRVIITYFVLFGMYGNYHKSPRLALMPKEAASAKSRYLFRLVRDHACLESTVFDWDVLITDKITNGYVM